MKRGKISRALDHIDDRFISEASEDKKTLPFYRDKRIASGITAVAAMLLLAIGIFYFNRAPEEPYNPGFDKVLTTSVAIDVNPGIEILVDDRELVLELSALNSDAEAILSEINVLGESLDTALSAVIRKMIEKNYISADKNSVLLSVDADGRDSEAVLKTSLSDRIEALLSEKNISAAVIAQSYDKQGEDSGEISKSKAALIKRIISSGLSHKDGTPYTFEELRSLRVNDLNLLLDSKKLTLEGAVSRGEAALSGLKTAEEAREIAFNRAAIDPALVEKIEVELDFEDGIMVYEVEFELGGFEYEYEINADSGEIIEEEIEETEKDDED